MRKKWWFVSIGECKWSVPEDVQAALKSVGTEDDDDVLIKVVQRT